MTNQSKLIWSLYLIRCEDGSLYTGITNDALARMSTQLAGKSGAAKALRAKKPLRLAFIMEVGDRSEAARLEPLVKKLRKAQKEALVRGERSMGELLGLI